MTAHPPPHITSFDYRGDIKFSLTRPLDRNTEGQKRVYDAQPWNQQAGYRMREFAGWEWPDAIVSDTIVDTERFAFRTVTPHESQKLGRAGDERVSRTRIRSLHFAVIQSESRRAYLLRHYSRARRSRRPWLLEG